MNATIRLLRPKQWSKNLLVFAAVLFTNEIRNGRALGLSAVAFVSMCLISSCIYILNDIRDIERDRAHPTKKLRPLAAGIISKSAALAIGILVTAVGIALLSLLPRKAFFVVGAYVALQLLYNFGAKSVPVLDVFLISSGFVLRAILGAAAIDQAISAWLLLCTGALALLLGFAKRRHEYLIQGEKRKSSRASLDGYNRQSLDALVIMSATASALCYGIYALQSRTAILHPALFITAVFVFYGICRYVLIVFVDEEGGEPETLLFKDKHILASVVLFIVTAALAVTTGGFPLVEVGTR